MTMTGQHISYRLFHAASSTSVCHHSLPTLCELQCRSKVYHQQYATARYTIHNRSFHHLNRGVKSTGVLNSASTNITLKCRNMSVDAGPIKKSETVNESIVSTWLTSYENFIGVKDVKEAQEKVTMTEKEFLKTRQEVKDSRQELEGIQSELHSIRTRLDRTPRDDPKFLEHATEEHRSIQVEKKVKENYHRLLDKEREIFDRLSASVRESHVKQKAQEEKTKYWSIIGSVVGTVLGIIGSTFISQRRTKDLKNMVNDLKEQISFLDGGAGEELKTILQAFKNTSAEMLSSQTKNGNLDDVSQKIIDQTENQLKSQEEVFNKLLQKHEKSFHDEIKGVRKAISIGGSSDMSTFEELIENAEQKLEWEVKMSTLATVVLVYGAFALTVPILYNIFK